MDNIVRSDAFSGALRSGIIGTGSALPRRLLSNAELAQLVDTTDEWIRERVGIEQRGIAGEGESTVALAHQASLAALAEAGLEAGDLDLIVVGTVTPDQHLPAAAALLQERLGTGGAMAFDLSAACSGFLFGLAVADGLMAVNPFRNALVVGSENLSKIIDWTDRETCVLFGDGAGAVVLSRGAHGSSVIASDLHTAAGSTDFICRPGGAFPPDTLPIPLGGRTTGDLSPYVQMKGREVFKAAVASMSSSMAAVLEQAGCSAEDVALFVPHQSNRRIIDAACRRIGLAGSDRVFINIESVGNTSAASIPIALDQAVRSGRAGPGDLVLMSAVGAGITYGSMLVRI